MNLRHAPLAALLALAAVNLPSAVAEESPADRDAFLVRVYGQAPGKNKTYACFARAYDAAHLAQHPKQKVSEMKLLVTAERDPEDKSLRNSFRLGLKYRNNRSGMFDSSGDCGFAEFDENDKRAKEPSFGCSVDCDGGGFNVRLTKDNKSAMLNVGRVRIWRNNKPDEEASYELEAGADDRLFRLDRTSLAQCMPLVHERKELAALRTLPKR